MAFAVTNTFTGTTTLAAADLDQNFSDIVGKINGNLDNSNLSGNAAIANTQLANDDYEIVLSTTVEGTATANEGLNNTVGGYFVVGGVPYVSANSTYEIKGIEHMLFLGTGGGGTAMIVDLDYGNHTDGWTTIKTGISTGIANQQTRESSFTTTFTTSSTRPNFFVLDITQQGVGFNDGDSWCISVLISHALRTL